MIRVARAARGAITGVQHTPTSLTLSLRTPKWGTCSGTNIEGSKNLRWAVLVRGHEVRLRGAGVVAHLQNNGLLGRHRAKGHDKRGRRVRLSAAEDDARRVREDALGDAPRRADREPHGCRRHGAGEGRRRKEAAGRADGSLYCPRRIECSQLRTAVPIGSTVTSGSHPSVTESRAGPSIRRRLTSTSGTLARCIA